MHRTDCGNSIQSPRRRLQIGLGPFLALTMGLGVVIGLIGRHAVHSHPVQVTFHGPFSRGQLLCESPVHYSWMDLRGAYLPRTSVLDVDFICTDSEDPRCQIRIVAKATDLDGVEQVIYDAVQADARLPNMVDGNFVSAGGLTLLRIPGNGGVMYLPWKSEKIKRIDIQFSREWVP